MTHAITRPTGFAVSRIIQVDVRPDRKPGHGTLRHHLLVDGTSKKSHRADRLGGKTALGYFPEGFGVSSAEKGLAGRTGRTLGLGIGRRPSR